MPSSADLLELAQDAWLTHTGTPSPDWRLFDSTVFELKTTLPGEKELRAFVRDSVAAWVWSHRNEQNVPIPNLNTTLTAESNTRRLEAYRAMGGNSLSRGIQMSDEVLLSEQEWLQWVACGSLPDFECFRPCAAWVMASSLWKRPMDDISLLKSSRDETGNPFGKTLLGFIQATSTKSGCEAFLRTVQPSLNEALEIHLCQAGWLSINLTEESGLVKRCLREGVLEILAVNSLRKRDKMIASLAGVSLVRSWEEQSDPDADDEEAIPKKRVHYPLVNQSLINSAKTFEDA